MKAKEKEINLDDYEMLQAIGTGSFGKVRLVKDKKTEEYFALKMLKKTEIIRLKQVDHVFSEIEIMLIIDHPFIVKMHGINQDDKNLSFLLDYIPGGELYSQMKNEGKLEIELARFYSSQVVLMFEYLHSKDIVYRDLKPENLLISANGYLKLVDFGLAKICKGKTYTLCGTPEYLAPEILMGKGHGKPVDWWCLGIFIYEILSGIPPFYDDDPLQVYQKILKGKVRFPRGINKHAKNLIKHFLIANIEERYGCGKNIVDQIKNHRWFREINFGKLIEFQIIPPYIPPLV